MTSMRTAAIAALALMATQMSFLAVLAGMMA